jgi:hypothetical protein
VPGVHRKSGVVGGGRQLEWRPNGARPPKILKEQTTQQEKTK